MGEAIKITQLMQNIYLFSDIKSDYHGNASVIVTSEGPVIIDVFRDKWQFDYIKNFIKDLGYDSPAAIIYTHWHSDHTCGNMSYINCKVIASESTKKHLESFISNDLDRLKLKNILEKDAMPVLPNITFTGKTKLTIGERSFELVHCPGHSYDSILIHDETSHTLFVGDNLVGQEVAFFVPPVIPPDEADAKAEDLKEAFRTIESFHSKILVPGHGSLTDPEDLLKLNRNRYDNCLKMNLRFMD